jgi:hypothetical protein
MIKLSADDIHPSWKSEEIDQESITWLLENNTRWLRDDTAKAGKLASIFYFTAERIAKLSFNQHEVIREVDARLAKGAAELKDIFGSYFGE